MNHVAKRTVTALTTAALVVAGLVYLPGCVVQSALVVLIALVQLEFLQMISKKYETMPYFGVALGLSVIGVIIMPVAGPPGWSAGVAGHIPSLFISLFVLMWLKTLYGKFKNPLAALGTTVLSVVYIPVMLSFLVLIDARYGVMTLLYTVAIVKISDMGGFAFGLGSKKLFGSNHRMCPSISPNKSWEGMFGSVFGSCLISCSFMPLTGFSFGKSMLLGAVAAVAGTLGDLVESRFKRECDVKDSATFMPAGLGGFLDMFDSLVFAPAVLYPFLGK